jgi:LacI family transcriptional regulator
MAPIFESESVTFCKKLIKSKVPFVFIDGYIENTGFLAYIGRMFTRAGRLQDSSSIWLLLNQAIFLL